MRKKGQRGLLGVVFVVALLGIGAFSAISPSTASACTVVTNPDGSKTCTSDQFSDPCNVPGAFIVDYIPNDATIVDHEITHSPACAGATIVDGTLEDNVTGFSPPPGHRAVRVQYTITCNSPPCMGSTTSTLSITYTQPSSGGGSGGSGGNSSSPPPASAAGMPTTHPVDPKTGRAVIEFQLSEGDTINQTYDLTEVLMFFIGGGAPKSMTLAAATGTAGTIADAHHAPGERTIRTTLKLNGKGRKALRAKGKLRVTMSGKLKNAAGSTPFSGTLKLVAKKSKK
jgi:hypothetical protein